VACGAYVLGQERSQGSEHASTTIPTDSDAVDGGMAWRVSRRVNRSLSRQ